MHGINEIKQLSEILDWYYIPSEQNPADLCTRTQTDFKLIQQKWFYDPETICQKKNFRSKGDQYQKSILEKVRN